MAALRSLPVALTPGHVLTEADLVALSDALEPAWRGRQRRLDLRDVAVREAALDYPALRPTARAHAVASDLGRFVTGGPVRHPGSISRVAALNANRVLSRRQVLAIMAGHRD